MDGKAAWSLLDSANSNWEFTSYRKVGNRSCLEADWDTTWEIHRRGKLLYDEKGDPMPTETTYTNLRENLAGFLHQVVDQQETVIVRRKGARDVALIPVGELTGLIETAHLLRSPRNTRRLTTALRRAERGKTAPGNAADLRREILGAKKR